MTTNVQKMTEEQLEAFGAVLRADVKKKLHDALLHRLMNGATNAQMTAILPGENPHHLKDIINGLWGFDEIARVAAALNLGVEVSFTLNGVQPPQVIVPPMTDEDVAKMSAQFNDRAKHVVVENGNSTMDALGVWTPLPLAKVDGPARTEQIGDGLSADI